MYSVPVRILPMEPDSPSLEELEALRSTLVQQIEGAHALFSAEDDAYELLTGQAALVCVEELIQRIQEQKR